MRCRASFDAYRCSYRLQPVNLKANVARRTGTSRAATMIWLDALDGVNKTLVSRPLLNELFN
jgi:hypothetical protein